MNEWYTQFSWGAEYYDDNAAHELGHMFGLFDEYARVEPLTETNFAMTA